MASLHRAQKPIRARGSNKCPHHQGKEVVFVCEDCDGELVCTTCVSTIHKKHAMEEIRDVIPQVKVTIHDFVNKTENTYIPELRGEMKNLDSEVTKNKKHFKDVIGKILKQKRSLTQKLNKITDKLIKLCREIEVQNNEILRNHKAELQSRIEELNARIHELKNTLQTGTDTQVFDTSRDIPNDIMKPNFPSMQDAEFNPTLFLIKDLENLLGQFSSARGVNSSQVNSSLTSGQHHAPDVSEDDEIHDTSDVDTKSTSTPITTKKSAASNKAIKDNIHSLTLFKTFETPGGDIHGIQSAPDNQIWVKTVDAVLQLLDHTGQAKKTMKMDADILVTDFCLSASTGDVWFCSDSGNSVRKLTEDNKSTVMFYTDSLPLSLCISADGNILVGMARQIVKYTQRGQILCKSAQVKQRPTVRYPFRISPCPVTRNIVVMDRDYTFCGGDGKTHLSVLSEDLQLLCRYGQDIKSFYPCDVCYNDTGDIYISVNNSIQQISGRGKFIQTLYTDRDSDKQAMCLSKLSNGDIWTVFCRGFDVKEIAILQKQ